MASTLEVETPPDLSEEATGGAELAGSPREALSSRSESADEKETSGHTATAYEQSAVAALLGLGAAWPPSPDEDSSGESPTFSTTSPHGIRPWDLGPGERGYGSNTEDSPTTAYNSPRSWRPSMGYDTPMHPSPKRARAPKDGAPPPGTSRFRCKFPGCRKLYASTDAVRKHCRKRHLEWLRQIDRYSTHEVNITRRENPAPPCLLPCCATPLFKPAALPTVRSRRFRLFPSLPPSIVGSWPHLSLSPKRQRGTPKPALYCVWGDDEVNECGQY